MQKNLPRTIPTRRLATIVEENCTKTKKRNLSNGLQCEPEKYKLVDGKIYIVANICSNTGENLILDSVDFNLLTQNNYTEWLNNFQIQYYMFVLLKKYKVPDQYQILDAVYVNNYKIFTNESCEKEQNFNYSKNRYLVMPYNQNNNHWVLAIADTTLKVFYFFDSLKKTPKSQLEASRIYLKKFNDFLKKININNVYALVPLQYNVQKDSFNCGTYILFFFEKFVSDKIFISLNFSPMLYRKQIKNDIIQLSENMKNKCLYCSRDLANTELVKCTICKRYIHRRHTDGYHGPPKCVCLICS